MISVVTPSFNQSEWLRLAVASVSDQEGIEVEHIVQDALSTDGTRDWLSKDHRVQAVFERDDGMYDAINRGLQRARGDICAYLNCDEQYLPGTLAKVEQMLAAHPKTQVLFGDFVLTDTSGKPLSYRRVVLPTLQHLSLAPLGTGTCATFFRRSLLDRGFCFDPSWKASGDAVWVERLLKARVTMAVISEPLAIFTITNENLGASGVSHAEGQRRRANNETPISRARSIMGYRLRKAIAGAYLPRRVEIDIYTQKSPDVRQHIVQEYVGFRWSKSSASD